MKYFFVPCLLIMLAVPLISLAAGEGMWVTSQGSRLKSGQGMSASTIEVVPVGSKVQILDKQGRWYKIRTPSGNRGWMYQGRLSRNKPLTESESGESSDMFGSLTGSKIEARQADTSRSIRGLSPETEAYANKQQTPQEYRKALDQIIERKVSNQELARFLRRGKIGEYAN